MRVLAIIAIVLLSTVSASAQFSTGADIVSSYVWRGVPQEGTKGTPNIQPYVSFTTGCLTIGSWASSSFIGNVKEVDLYATYVFSSSLALTVTDYNWGFNNSYFKYSKGGDHMFEATLAFTGGESFPISASVNTFFAGADTLSTGKNAFSTYAELSYPITTSAKVFLGASLTESAMVYGTTGFGITNLGIKVSKLIPITDKFSLPVYSILSANPYSGNAFFVAGITL